jgi:hypothetical protein
MLDNVGTIGIIHLDELKISNDKKNRESTFIKSRYERKMYWINLYFVMWLFVHLFTVARCSQMSRARNDA